MRYKSDSVTTDQVQIKEEIDVTDPAVIPIIFHEKKSLILQLLIKKEMTIIDLKKTIKMNPGTIKRHINDLLKYNLVFVSRTEKNEFSIIMKYYRASAKRFNFEISWP